jgi:hypothetical protein
MRKSRLQFKIILYQKGIRAKIKMIIIKQQPKIILNQFRDLSAQCNTINAAQVLKENGEYEN